MINDLAASLYRGPLLITIQGGSQAQMQAVVRALAQEGAERKNPVRLTLHSVPPYDMGCWTLIIEETPGEHVQPDPEK